MAEQYPTAHINATPSDFAPTVLMPGDPLRSEFIAKNFKKDIKIQGLFAVSDEQAVDFINKLSGDIDKVYDYVNQFADDFEKALEEAEKELKEEQSEK